MQIVIHFHLSVIVFHWIINWTLNISQSFTLEKTSLVVELLLYIHIFGYSNHFSRFHIPDSGYRCCLDFRVSNFKEKKEKTNRRSVSPYLSSEHWMSIAWEMETVHVGHVGAVLTCLLHTLHTAQILWTDSRCFFWVFLSFFRIINQYFDKNREF